MRTRKLLAILLAFVMIAGMCPVSVFATETPVLEVGVSQRFELPVDESVSICVTVAEGGWYGVYFDTQNLNMYVPNVDGNGAFYGYCDDNGGEYRYVYLPESGTYTLEITNWSEETAFTMLMRLCDQPTELYITERVYSTVGSWVWLEASFGSFWEYGYCQWSFTDAQTELETFGEECQFSPQNPGTFTLTAQITGADGTPITAACTVTVYEKWEAEVGDTREMTISPDSSLNFWFTPETTGFYVVQAQAESDVYVSLLDTQEEMFVWDYSTDNDTIFWLEGGKKYEGYVSHTEMTEQSVTLRVKAPTALVQGEETPVTVDGENSELFVFTPAESGTYSLRIDENMYSSIYNSEPQYMPLNGMSDAGYLYTAAALEAGESYLYTIGGYDAGYSTTILLDVAPLPESIDIDSDSITLVTGQESVAYVYANPRHAGDSYTWYVEDENVAVVSSVSANACWIEGVSAGTTTLWCESGSGLTDSATIIVKEPIRCTLAMGQTQTVELAEDQTVSLEFTAPEEGWYVFYFDDTDLAWINVWYHHYKWIDGCGAMYIYCGEGETIENTFTNLAYETVTREFTVDKTIPAETVSLGSEDYYVMEGSSLYLEPDFGSILEWENVAAYSIDNQDVVTDVCCNGIQVELLAVGIGTAQVTLVTESGLTASCNVHVLEPTGGELELDQPADVRYFGGDWNFYSFTPEESGDYTVSVDVPRGVWLEIYSEDYEEWNFEYYPAGTKASMSVYLNAGVAYRIDTAADENDYAEGTILVEKTRAVAEVATGWSGYTTWVLTDDGTLTFSGEGAMKNYTYKSEMPWYQYADQITDVVIEEGVTSIGSYAFYGMNMESIEISESVTSIGDYAFKGTASLDNVVLPAGLTQLGDSAFYGCTSLTAIEIPASLWTIKPYTFKNCTALAEVTFNEGNLQKISDGAFYGTAVTEVTFPDCLDILDVYSFKNCAALETINLGSGLTEIREAVFYGTAIPTISIPEGITKIGPYAFKNCAALESIELPESLTSVGEASFYACTGLQAVTLPDAVNTIGNYAFRKCAALERLTFGADLVTIGECSFYGCTALTELVIPDSVTTIKPYAFKTCTGLTAVTLGSGVKTIGEGAFNTCTGLKALVFPASLTSIGDYCFSGSWNLWKLTFRGDAPAIGTGAFKGLDAYAYYPGDNATWTSAVMQNYGGAITWTAN